ncbi:MAG: ATP-dependent helicase HrpB [Gemmatimonadetes bacterium]|nr:ATP-dependent helicase HrpB [Gemmatimonadota bacterium]
MTLPIDQVLDELRLALEAGTSAVLQAPPGAGKTTRVPLALLESPWLQGQKILMLEPRRLAARASARRMADTLGEPVGRTVGFRVRHESRVSRDTRIEVVTEGILTRMIQHDPTLAGVGLVIFDEFHERNLQGDLGLALALQSRALLREELRVLVMSATIDTAPVAMLLGGARVITSLGRAFPVALHYRPVRDRQRVEDAAAAAVREALAAHEGDLLVFLPGAGEIMRTAERLESLANDVVVAPLFGALGNAEQDRAIMPDPQGRRRVLLATDIAETSLTIEGIRVVVDAGLSRVPRFSPRTGMTRLETVRVTQASAQQRAGRAGRVAPGACVRLWNEHEQQQLRPFRLPEIVEADLAPLALELAAAGIEDPLQLEWLDAPPASALLQARELLRELEAVDASGRATPHGLAMARFPVHPRLAHMVLAGVQLQHGGLACDLAALLAERDVLRGETFEGADADIRLRLELLHRTGAPEQSHRGLRVDRDALRRVREESQSLRRTLGLERGASGGDAECGRLVGLAYPDRIAQRREGDAPRYRLRNGLGAQLVGSQSLAREEWLVAAVLDGKLPEGRVLLAAPIDRADVELSFSAQVTTREVAEWDERTRSVRARRRRTLGALVLESVTLAEPGAEESLRVLLEVIRDAGIAALPWRDHAMQLRDRLRFAATVEPSRWPHVSDEALLATLDEWLAPALQGSRRWSDVERLDLGALLVQSLPWAERNRLDALAPTHYEAPTGSRLSIDYADPLAPAVSVRLQEMFGVSVTPAVGGGRVPLTLHLLSPAQRPVQVTRDLAGFWASSYFDVRKDLRGRYPRHPWPDDPASATPTRRAKRST